MERRARPRDDSRCVVASCAAVAQSRQTKSNCCQVIFPILTLLLLWALQVRLAVCISGCGRRYAFRGEVCGMPFGKCVPCALAH